MMRSKKLNKEDSPQKAIRRVFDACSDCDSCRFLMDESCLLFPELYRLYDKEKEDGKAADDDELLKLTDLCTLCGLCPCPDIRADVIRSKTRKVRKEGMPLSIRLLADVQFFARLSGLMPRVVNTFLQIPVVAGIIKKIVQIHPRRPIPLVAPESFFDWAHRKGLDRAEGEQPKVAYFAGCTAGYFFPPVARAAVASLEKNGINVYVPPQQCCGMPTLLEGDEATTLTRVKSNMKILLETARDGYDLVCSCPTCGFLLKRLLKENAFYSEAYQHSIDAGADEIRFPENRGGKTGLICLKKSMYRDILKDDGYFSDLDPLKRIDLSRKVMDLGEYLEQLYRENRLDIQFGKLNKRVVYFAPCHQREQEIGTPYEKLLRLVPGLSIQRIGGALDCCGMGGSLGYKKNFHEASLSLGKTLMQKIKTASPDAIITDCLSCRLQFTHTLPYPVLHPLELISEAYDAAHLSSLN
ncbi:MAG: heterodisulfide reductase-related iron-sulfur binding cluster [Desulfobacterales bacterium]